MTRAVILSGGGRYRDPWHPFGRTSELLAGILTAEGLEVEVTEDVAGRVADLAGADLIVVNAAAGPPQDTTAARAGLRTALARGIGILAVHVGVTTLLGLPEWEPVTGAAWVNGQTMHPKAGMSRVRVHHGHHPITAAAGPEFELHDERYSYLRLAPGIEPLAEHEFGGRWHPLLWSRACGRAPVVADALGHDARSYDSPEHRELIAGAVRWLAGTALAPSGG